MARAPIISSNRPARLWLKLDQSSSASPESASIKRASRALLTVAEEGETRCGHFGLNASTTSDQVALWFITSTAGGCDDKLAATSRITTRITVSTSIK